MRLGAFLGFASIASKLGLSRTRMGNGLATVGALASLVIAALARRIR